MTVAKPKKSVRVSRKIPPDIKKPVRALAVATGELIWAANQTHAAFANIFFFLVDAKNPNVGISLWHSVQGDSAQRQMLAAVVEARLIQNARMRDYLVWAKNKADKLSEIRNDAAHLATAYRTDTKPFTILPSPIGNAPKRVNRLAATPDLTGQFQIVKNDYVQLGNFVTALFPHLVRPEGPYLWPKKPVLKSIAREISNKKRMARA